MKIVQSILRATFLAMCLTAGALLPALAGEVRVLLAFDNAGHQVREILRIERGTSIFDGSPVQSTDRQLPNLSELGSELERGLARLVWLDEQGLVSAVTHEPDPRLAHGPQHIVGDLSSQVGDRKGAWLVSGPDDARSLVILMPIDERVGLAFEQWEVYLDSRH